MERSRFAGEQPNPDSAARRTVARMHFARASHSPLGGNAHRLTSARNVPNGQGEARNAAWAQSRPIAETKSSTAAAMLSVAATNHLGRLRASRADAPPGSAPLIPGVVWRATRPRAAADETRRHLHSPVAARPRILHVNALFLDGPTMHSRRGRLAFRRSPKRERPRVRPRMSSESVRITDADRHSSF